MMSSRTGSVRISATSDQAVSLRPQSCLALSGANVNTQKRADSLLTVPNETHDLLATQRQDMPMRHGRAPRPNAMRVKAETCATWPGPGPRPRDQERLQEAMKRHQETHSVEDAASSMQMLHAIMVELESENVIPNKNAMQIYLQHCCAKSASFEMASFALGVAADLALRMMEKHRCRFEASTVVQIAMHVSLRAEMGYVAHFLGCLIRKAMTHLEENERSFLERHMSLALAERKEATVESLGRLETFSERGFRIHWESSTSQEFHVYNTAHHTYKPIQGYGFARKNLVALLSIDADPSSVQYSNYNRQRDGAIVDVIKAVDGEALVVRLRTHVAVPFRKDLFYRLDDMDIAEVQTKRVMESLRALSRDPQCSRLIPNPELCRILLVPSGEQYTIRVLLRPNDSRLATLERELDFLEQWMEPIRVTSIGSGALLDWNTANPRNRVHVGDRIVEINGFRDRDEMVDEILTAQGCKYEMKITLMRNVKMEDRHVPTNILLPSAPDIERVFAREQQRLREKLNASQVEAVRNASSHRLFLIQGPPGTGKTTTAVELLDFLVVNKLVPTPILASGHTNAAVDNILAGLSRKGRRVVRIGEGEKVRAECKPYVLGEEKAADLQSAEVVCATCIGSGSGVLSKEGLKFHTVLIDECSQATETACLVPVCRAAQQLILVGDQCQLQPMIKSDLVRSQDLGTSLFNRLCRQGVRPIMLDTQYRMHPALCDFASGAFYNGLLLTGVRHTDRRPTKYWEWPSPLAPVCFIDAADGWDSSSDGRNQGHEVTNKHEVDIVLYTLDKVLRDQALRSKDEDGTYRVGIITPYAAQRELIMREIEKVGLLDARGKHIVETNSVDGFQGREKDVIIFSAVRSNDSGTVGFLHDWRRINVMLTRAKRGLIVIGNRETLKTDIFWKSWLKWAATHGCIQGESASGSWKPVCLVEDEWVMNPQDSGRESNSSASAIPITSAMPEISCDDGWGSCTRSTQESIRIPLPKPSENSGLYEGLFTNVESDVDANGSTATNISLSLTMPSVKATASAPVQDVGSWEDLVSDVESEVNATCSTATDVESSAGHAANDSWMTESLVSSAAASMAEESWQDFVASPIQVEHVMPIPNELTVSSVTQVIMHSVGVSPGESKETKVPAVSRLRSKEGQQKQRDRQKQRRQEHRQTGN